MALSPLLFAGRRTKHTAQSCEVTTVILVMQVPQSRAQSNPLVDYILPIWPSIECFNPARSDTSTITPSSQFSKYLAAVTNKGLQFSTNGLFFTAQYALTPPPSRCLLAVCTMESRSLAVITMT